MKPDWINFEMPGIPPSVNMYVRHTKTGRHYVSADAKNFQTVVGLYSRGKRIRAEEYGVKIVVYLGYKQKGDVDNFAKVVLDSMVKCEVIDSDAKVMVLHLFKFRDRDNPRTDVTVWAIGPDLES